MGEGLRLEWGFGGLDLGFCVLSFLLVAWLFAVES